MPNADTYLNQPPIFEWYVVTCGCKNGHQIDICSEEIGLRAQHLVTVLGSVVNIIGGGLCG